jgi:hypothetical protein
MDLKVKKKLVKRYTWSTVLYGTATWVIAKLDHKYLESFEMWCSRIIEDISWKDHERNKKVLQRVRKERNNPERKSRKATGLVTSCVEIAL